MPVAVESRGLKITVAVFITLTVVLLVTSFFLYSAYASALAAAIRAKADDEQTNEEIIIYLKKVDEMLNTLAATVDLEVAKAQAEGAQGPILEDAANQIRRLIASYRNDKADLYIIALPVRQGGREFDTDDDRYIA